MPNNSIDLVTVQNLVNALIVFIAAMIALFTAGGVGVFVVILRQNKRNLELAYQALPPDWQQTIRDVITQAKSITDLAAEVTTPPTPPALPPNAGIPAPAPIPIAGGAAVATPPVPEG